MTSTNLFGGAYPSNVFTHSVDLKSNIVRVGVNYKFGGPSSPGTELIPFLIWRGKPRLCRGFLFRRGTGSVRGDELRQRRQDLVANDLVGVFAPIGEQDEPDLLAGTRPI